jgi:hypothetical protein
MTHVERNRAEECDQVDPAVLVEALILSRNRGLTHNGRNLRERQSHHPMCALENTRPSHEVAA